MILIPFEPAHVRAMTPQAAQLGDVQAQSLEANFGDAWTGLIDGRIVGCAGIVEVWPGRAYAWALLADGTGPHMLKITREIRSRLAAAPFARVEMTVDAEFSEGCRWAEILGFSLETPQPMRNFLPNGKSAYLYARVN